MERKPPYEKQIKNRSNPPKVPPLHEEPLRGIEPGKIVCVICRKAFTTKSQLDRHLLTEHESPKGKESLRRRIGAPAGIWTRVADSKGQYT
jgi:hypothetical protein